MKIIFVIMMAMMDIIVLYMIVVQEEIQRPDMHATSQMKLLHKI